MTASAESLHSFCFISIGIVMSLYNFQLMKYHVTRRWKTLPSQPFSYKRCFTFMYLSNAVESSPEATSSNESYDLAEGKGIIVRWNDATSWTSNKLLNHFVVIIGIRDHWHCTRDRQGRCCEGWRYMYWCAVTRNKVFHAESCFSRLCWVRWLVIDRFPTY